jgi:predicted ATP-grasp superfamily ATP-dependent carboligase
MLSNRHSGGATPGPGNVPGALVLGGAHGSLAVARSLGRRQIPVWFVTHDHPLAALSRYTKRFLRWDGPDQKDAIAYLLDLAHLYNLDGWVLFAGGDAEVRLVAQHHAELSKIFRVTTPPWSITQFAYNKNLTYQHAGSIGIDYPATYHPRDRDAVAKLACRFPIVLKPAVREQANAFTISKGWKVGDAGELLSRYDEAVALVGHDAIILQEFVPGTGRNQFSYAGVWDRGAPIASLVARRARQFPIEFGFTSTFVETVVNSAVENAACRYLASLSYSGIAEIEFKFDERDNSYKLLDFNARPWTWMALGEVAGVDFPYLLMHAAARNGAPTIRGSAGVTWMHLARDLVAAFQHIAAGSLAPSTYVQSLRLPMVFAAFAWDDPLPGMLELPLTLYRVLTRRVASAMRTSMAKSTAEVAR